MTKHTWTCLSHYTWKNAISPFISVQVKFTIKFSEREGFRIDGKLLKNQLNSVGFWALKCSGTLENNWQYTWGRGEKGEEWPAFICLKASLVGCFKCNGWWNQDTNNISNCQSRSVIGLSNEILLMVINGFYLSGLSLAKIVFVTQLMQY